MSGRDFLVGMQIADELEATPHKQRLREQQVEQGNLSLTAMRNQDQRAGEAHNMNQRLREQAFTFAGKQEGRADEVHTKQIAGMQQAQDINAAREKRAIKADKQQFDMNAFNQKLAKRGETERVQIQKFMDFSQRMMANNGDYNISGQDVENFANGRFDLLEIVGLKSDFDVLKSQAANLAKGAPLDKPATIGSLNKTFVHELNKNNVEGVVARRIVDLVPAKDDPESINILLEVEHEDGTKTIKPMTRDRSADPNDPVKAVKLSDLLGQVNARGFIADVLSLPQNQQVLARYANQGQGKKGDVVTVAGMEFSPKEIETYQNLFEESVPRHGNKKLMRVEDYLMVAKQPHLAPLVNELVLRNAQEAEENPDAPLLTLPELMQEMANLEQEKDAKAKAAKDKAALADRHKDAPSRVLDKILADMPAQMLGSEQGEQYVDEAIEKYNQGADKRDQMMDRRENPFSAGYMSNFNSSTPVSQTKPKNSANTAANRPIGRVTRDDVKAMLAKMNYADAQASQFSLAGRGHTNYQG